MIDEQILKALQSLSDPRSQEYLSGIVRSAENSDFYKLVQAAIYNMTTQVLLAGGKDLVDFGRVQGVVGVQGFIDYLYNLPDLKRTSPSPDSGTKDPNPSTTKQGGYGAV